MAEFIVRCTTKPKRSSAHHEITHLGNHLDHPTWHLTVDEVIQRIDGGDRFVVLNEQTGGRASILVRRDDEHSPYVQAAGAALYSDELLRLPDCPRLQ
jgi:Protein of unknown function (DUF3892)